MPTITPGRRTEYFTTAELLAALERLGGAGTSTEITAEALGEERPTAAQRMRAGELLGNASDQVRQTITGCGYAKPAVWRLRVQDEGGAQA